MKKLDKHPAYLKQKLAGSTATFSALALVFLAILEASALIEIGINRYFHPLSENLAGSILFSLTNTALFWLTYLFPIWLLYILLYFLSAKLSRLIIIIVFCLIAFSNFLLIKYFVNALTPLGADLFGYSSSEIKQTLGSSGAFSLGSVLALLTVIALLIFLFLKLPDKIKLKPNLSLVLPLLSAIFLITGLPGVITESLATEYSSNLRINKTQFFASEIYRHFFPQTSKVDIYDDAYFGFYDSNDRNVTRFTYSDQANFPFLHLDSSANTLSAFFRKGDQAPNIVFILVEGLGRAFSNENAYLGSFTPFLDSLSNQSLYFPNLLSAGGRTFAALPSVLGSLPFARKGFMELDNMPKHLSILSILKKAGYHTSFYYGGDASFDYMDRFLKQEQIDEINDMKTFPAGYAKLPAENGFTWGYNDLSLYRNYLRSRKEQPTKPQLSVLLTVSSHSPFRLNEENKYLNIFQKRLNDLELTRQQRAEYTSYKYQYASILYTDDALRSFINSYKQRKDFANTIFLITGDHRMPEIPMSNKIDRYHVPLIIFSPLLKKSNTFKAISTHFDITPSLLAFLNQEYGIRTPRLCTWVGSGLDTAHTFRNTHSFPLMQTKTTLTDFVSEEYHINNGKLYKLSENMEEEAVNDGPAYKKVNALFIQFKNRNSTVGNKSSLLPDSVYKMFYPAR